MLGLKGGVYHSYSADPDTVLYWVEYGPQYSLCEHSTNEGCI